ncbi:unnamed protein product [Ostreobium quekettii]|uniref:Uncharacterized protein n=1 Tax=Ostreobium quekettii TaxID=121088 RepID=A0A8S1ILH1_9CHLO|nr:unnamed protein product [Ostreobium quekettii]
MGCVHARERGVECSGGQHCWLCRCVRRCLMGDVWSVGVVLDYVMLYDANVVMGFIRVGAAVVLRWAGDGPSGLERTLKWTWSDRVGVRSPCGAFHLGGRPKVVRR